MAIYPVRLTGGLGAELYQEGHRSIPSDLRNTAKNVSRTPALDESLHGTDSGLAKHTVMKDTVHSRVED